MSDLTWGRERKRVAIVTLQRPIDGGGLGLPDLELYYAAAQLQWPMKWLAQVSGPETKLLHRDLGGRDILNWLLGTSVPGVQASTLIRVAWKCWKRYVQPKGVPPPYAPGLPLWSVPELAVLLKSHSAAPWRRACIVRLGDIFEEGTLMTFQRLQDLYELNAQAFLSYGALGGVLQEVWENGRLEPNTHIGLSVFLSHGLGGHAVTNLYKALRGSQAYRQLAIKDKWDKEGTNENITLAQWETALTYVKRVSRNARLKYTQFNYLHQTYLTPHRLHAIFPTVSAKCPRCTCADADFLHMVWHCAELKQRREQVMKIVTDIIVIQLPVNPLVCLLGTTKRTKKNKFPLRFADLAMVLFKRLIAKKWKASLPPTLTEWLREVHKWATAEADFLTGIVRQKGGDTVTTPWDLYLIKIAEMLANGDVPT